MVRFSRVAGEKKQRLEKKLCNDSGGTRAPFETPDAAPRRRDVGAVRMRAAKAGVRAQMTVAPAPAPLRERVSQSQICTLQCAEFQPFEFTWENPHIKNRAPGWKVFCDPGAVADTI